jgi:FMN phosphatase YigB (HAD superfamily)
MRALLFDLDNTLYPESDYFRAIFSQFSQNQGLAPERFAFLFNDFDQIRFTQRDIFRYALNQASEFSEARHQALFELFVGIGCELSPYKGVQELIDWAFSQNLRIGVLTNGHIEAQSNKWNCLNLVGKEHIHFAPARLFGADKPASASFEEMMIHMGCRAEEMLFIGDRFGNDIKWGLEQGGSGALVNAHEKGEGVPSFESFQELMEWIRE